ncbi:hypothetical protein C8Q76DRAFT_751047 [Earliella scabrosa]|nr:hypothetical protein C8Q76DRAFT_751047 [Earliella scabrosa]
MAFAPSLHDDPRFSQLLVRTRNDIGTTLNCCKRYTCRSVGVSSALSCFCHPRIQADHGA